MELGDGIGSAVPPLGDRYNVISELGKGGFGQTYLAEDLHRFKERCVLKEFVPQVQDKDTLDKAKELFEREASILYQLSHKQIPEFRQLLKVETSDGGRLFLVQDYVQGRTYQDLLRDRQQVGATFSETEITQLLYQLLPVLSYIHDLGLIHRDISPDNLILRQSDGLPVLIDFGSVKEIAVTVRSELFIDGVQNQINLAPTRIGKVGYVPEEQFNSGKADSTSDLYGLAVTALVLLTGQQPQVLHDTYLDTWTGIDTLSPHLGQILKKMLSNRPANRFPTANAVLAALSQPANNAVGDGMGASRDSVYPPDIYPADSLSSVPSSDPSTDNLVTTEPIDYTGTPIDPMVAMGSIGSDPTHTAYDASTYEASHGHETTANESSTYITSAPTPPGQSGGVFNSGSKAPLIALLAVLGVLGTIMLFAWLRIARSPSPSQVTDPSELVSADGFSSEETARKQEIRDRHEALGIGENTFTRIVDQLFYQEYPSLLTSGPEGGRKALSQAPEDEPLRIRWDNIALDLLDRLEGQVSRQSLSLMGNYGEGDRANWQEQINRVNVGSKSLYDLTDAKFFNLFPSQRNRDFAREPIGQVYDAIANDMVDAITSGEVRENVEFEPGAFRRDLNDSLTPGAGRVYTLELTAGQQLRLNLGAPTGSTLLSLYLPVPTEDEPFILADSDQTTWTGRVNQDGYYEVVVVNRSAETIPYQLALAVDNVRTTEPVAPEDEELPPVVEEESSEEVDSDSDAEAVDESNETDDPAREDTVE
ncbi:MAG: serine/threonine-protein kinase [Cyanobacteria bacterium P01_D01_bin.1]